MKIISKIKVKNVLGLHTRPATAIVKLLQSSKCDISFTCRKETINAKSILSILALGVRRNSVITITVAGGDGEEMKTTMENLVQAFENRFGEH